MSDRIGIGVRAAAAHVSSTDGEEDSLSLAFPRIFV